MDIISLLRDESHRTAYECRCDEEGERLMKIVKSQAPYHCRHCNELTAEIDISPLCKRHGICYDNPRDCLSLPIMCIEECGDGNYATCHSFSEGKLNNENIARCLTRLAGKENIKKLIINKVIFK